MTTVQNFRNIVIIFMIYLKNDGILISSSIDTNDSTYNKYVDGKISINAFIKYAIKKNWISFR